VKEPSEDGNDDETLISHSGSPSHHVTLGPSGLKEACAARGFSPYPETGYITFWAKYFMSPKFNV